MKRSGLKALAAEVGDTGLSASESTLVTFPFQASALADRDTVTDGAAVRGCSVGYCEDRLRKECARRGYAVSCTSLRSDADWIDSFTSTPVKGRYQGIAYVPGTQAEIGGAVTQWLHRHRFGLIAATIFAGLVALGVYLLRPALMLSANDANQAAVLGRAIFVTGTLTAAAVTLVGILLRHSIDLRSDELAREAEGRQRLEAAMQTVGLLVTKEGKPVEAPQAAAALLVLSRLGELEIALSIAAELWKVEGGVTTRAVLDMCDSAFATGQPELQRMAAVLMRNNWNRIVEERPFLWPAILKEPNLPLDHRARDQVLSLLDKVNRQDLPPDAQQIIASTSAALQTRPEAGTALR